MLCFSQTVVNFSNISDNRIFQVSSEGNDN